MPTEERARRGLWEKQIQKNLMSIFNMSYAEARAVTDEISEMDIMTASAYLEGYRFYGAENVYADTAYRKGTREEINSYIAEKALDGILYSRENYEKIRRKIGYLPQKIDLYPGLSEHRGNKLKQCQEA